MCGVARTPQLARMRGAAGRAGRRETLRAAGGAPDAPSRVLFAPMQLPGAASLPGSCIVLVDPLLLRALGPLLLRRRELSTFLTNSACIHASSDWSKTVLEFLPVVTGPNLLFFPRSRAGFSVPADTTFFCSPRLVRTTPQGSKCASRACHNRARHRGHGRRARLLQCCCCTRCTRRRRRGRLSDTHGRGLCGGRDRRRRRRRRPYTGIPPIHAREAARRLRAWRTRRGAVRCRCDPSDALAQWPARPPGESVLGFRVKTMRDAVRNKER